MKTTALMIAFLFSGQKYNIDLAITPTEQMTGLMYRKAWEESSQGMLFINDKPRAVSFWMKNTYLNMIIFYLDAEYNILEIHKPKPLDEKSIPSKTGNVLYVLELNPEFETVVREDWTNFKTILKQEVDKKEKEINKLKRPL